MAGVLLVGSWLLPLLYLGLLIEYGALFFLRRRTHAMNPWLWVVIAVHAALLGIWTAEMERLPLADAQEVLSVVALALAAVYAIVEFAGRDRRTGVFMLSLVFLLQYTSTMLAAGRPESAQAASNQPIWTQIHLIPAIVAYTALGFSAVYGMLYLVAQHGLRRQRFGVFFDRLPPLDLLGRMTWHAMLVGFIFITLTIVTGPLLFGSQMAEGQMTAKIWSKIIAGSSAWVIYALALLGRWLGKWPLTRVAWIAIIGFVIVAALLGISAALS